MKLNFFKTVSSLLFIIFLILSGNANAQTGDIALLYSKVSEKMMNDQPGWIYNHLSSWEIFLMNNNIKYDVIDDDRLQEGISGDYQVLIIPACKYLSKESILSIKTFLNEGGSILITWQSGFFDEKGLQRNEAYLMQSFGINSIDVLPDSIMNFSDRIIGGTPFSFGINAGTPLFVINNKSLLFNTSLNNTVTNTFFAGSNSTYENSNIIFGSVGAGKFVWFGSDINSFTTGLEKNSVLSKLVINSINWLENKSMVSVDPWPKSKKSAVVVGYDIEHGFNNLSEFLGILKSDSLKAEFYIPTNTKYLDTLTGLKNFGDFCLSVDDEYKWRNLDSMSKTLQYLKSGLEELSGTEIISFDLLQKFYNKKNISVLSDNGIKIINSSLPFNDEVPHTYDKSKNIIEIPNPTEYDFEYKSKISGTTQMDLAKQLIMDYENVHNNGGVYVLKFHNLFQCQGDELFPLKQFIKKIKNDNVWITTLDKIHDWWILKENLNLKLLKENQNNFLITLKNNSNLSSDNFVINLVLPEIASSKNPEIKDGKNLLKYNLNSSSNEIKIFIEHISPGETKFININLNNIL